MGGDLRLIIIKIGVPRSQNTEYWLLFLSPSHDRIVESQLNPFPPNLMNIQKIIPVSHSLLGLTASTLINQTHHMSAPEIIIAVQLAAQDVYSGKDQEACFYIQLWRGLRNYMRTLRPHKSHYWPLLSPDNCLCVQPWRIAAQVLSDVLSVGMRRVWRGLYRAWTNARTHRALVHGSSVLKDKEKATVKDPPYFQIRLCTLKTWKIIVSKCRCYTGTLSTTFFCLMGM